MSEFTTVKDEYSAILTETLTLQGVERNAAEMAAIEQVKRLDLAGLLPVTKHYRRGGVEVAESTDPFDLSAPVSSRADEILTEPPTDLQGDEFAQVQYVTNWMSGPGLVR